MSSRIMLSGLTTKNRLSGLHMRFYNFFMKFLLDTSDRHICFKRKTQIIISGTKSYELEEYKLEQLRWITDTSIQNTLGNSAIALSFLIYECKRRISSFLSELFRYKNRDIDMKQIIEEGYKVTILSTLRPRVRPRSYGFDYTPKGFISQSPSDVTSTAYLWGGERSGFHSYTSAFRSYGPGS